LGEKFILTKEGSPGGRTLKAIRKNCFFGLNQFGREVYPDEGREPRWAHIKSNSKELLF